MMEAKIRKPAVAGSFYAGDAKELRQDVQNCFSRCKNPLMENIQAVIVPHAGYVFSGVTAASAFAAINPDAEYEHIFLLGPSHHVYLGKASVNIGASAYATPLGNVPVDTALCKDLMEKSDAITYAPEAHESEHCLEVELPFLQYHMKKIPSIVPIIIATLELTTLKKIADTLKPYLNEKNLFVISSDFSHYPAYKDAEIIDGLTKDSIMTGKVEAFVNATLHNQELGIDHLATSACGMAPIATLLMMTENDAKIKPHHVMYCNSGDSPYGGKDKVVGYHSFVFRNGKHKGDPEYVIFHIKRTDVGINHIGDKDADIARRLDEKINRNRGKKTSDDATQQGDLFAHVYQNPDKKIEVDTTQGFEQWNQFISMVQDTSQQALLGRCKFIGIKNDRFCIAASDDDFAALKTSGLERLAQEFFDCVGSFMPVFYRG